MFVITADQRGSSRGPDLVPEVLSSLPELPLTVIRGFERTAGDEVQGVLHDGLSVVCAMLHLVRNGRWSIGVGLGRVEDLPPSTRAGRGPAFVAARDAVEAAKRLRHPVAIRGRDPDGTTHLPRHVLDQVGDAETVAHLLANVLQQRTEAGWQAVDLLAQGLSVTEVGERLGITRQAAGQRLQLAGAALETRARITLARLLTVGQAAVAA